MSHLSSHCIATMYQDGDGRILQLICSSHVGGHQWSSIFRNSPNGKNLINTQYASNDKMQLMHKSTLSNHTVAPWASIMANILFTEETVVVLLAVRSQKKDNYMVHPNSKSPQICFTRRPCPIFYACALKLLLPCLNKKLCTQDNDISTLWVNIHQNGNSSIE